MTANTQTTKLTYGQMYEKNNLLYIRYDACIETRANGQKKIKGIDMPCYSKIRKQKQYKPSDGKYYSLLMGVEYLMVQEYVEIDVFLVLEVCLVELVL